MASLYTDVSTGEEYEQPASIVALCAYAINNVHLMLLSGIGTPYDPSTQRGVVGANYCYQPGGAEAGIRLFFEDKIFNPFMASGAFGAALDDFHASEQFDRGPVGGIGGATIIVGQSNGRPIQYSARAGGHASLGCGVEAGDGEVVPAVDGDQRRPRATCRTATTTTIWIRPIATCSDSRSSG